MSDGVAVAQSEVFIFKLSVFPPIKMTLTTVFFVASVLNGIVIAIIPHPSKHHAVEDPYVSLCHAAAVGESSSLKLFLLFCPL